jgi:uncharacterized protein with PIN domain
MSDTVRLHVPESLMWCVYRERVWEDRSLILPWYSHQSVKDCAESAGIPHTEIEQYILDNTAVPESELMSPGQELDLIPVDRFAYVERVFVLDVHLGKLAVFLRLAGFHALYDAEARQEELIELSHRDAHVLLTRSRDLLKHRDIERGMLLCSDDPEVQLKEVFDRYSLSSHVSILSICPVCGGRLDHVSKHHVLDRIKPGTIANYQDFYECSECSQVFWEGSHYPSFIRMLERVRSAE